MGQGEAGDSIPAQHLHSNYFKAFCYARYPQWKPGRRPFSKERDRPVSHIFHGIFGPAPPAICDLDL